jgi:hypothetical protein
MAVTVVGIDALLPPVAPLPRLALLVATGALSYGLSLLLTARPVIDELAALLGRPKPIPA